MTTNKPAFTFAEATELLKKATFVAGSHFNGTWHEGSRGIIATAGDGSVSILETEDKAATTFSGQEAAKLLATFRSWEYGGN